MSTPADGFVNACSAGQDVSQWIVIVPPAGLARILSETSSLSRLSPALLFGLLMNRLMDVWAL